MTYTLEPVIFAAPASFETLGEETLVPKKSVSVEPTRFSVIKAVGDEQAFPLADRGFPANAANGFNLGGRTIDDTQVSTVGVPLNLPHGGGTALSSLPSFLWSRVDIARTPLSAGLAPSSASGAINLELWTRDQILRKHHPEDPLSRLTGSYDRQVQNFSLATRQRKLAINGGMNYGMQTGPAGSLSYEFYRDSISTWRLHFIGTDQEGDSPGSKTFPTPQAKLDVYRLIPILETQRTLGGDVIWESTWFGDVSGIRNRDPSAAATDSNSKTEQYGTENVFVVDDSVFAVSARYVRFRKDENSLSATPAVLHDEWPLYASASHLFRLSSLSELKSTADVSAITTIGAAPGGRLSWRIKDGGDSTGAQFYELFTTGKMPTIQDRYYVFTGFAGNPNLKPERVFSAIAGYERKFKDWRTRTALKGEYRRDVQISNTSTVVNAGTAQLLYLDQEVGWAATGRLDLRANLLLSVSHLQDQDIPYPSLPAFSAKARAIYHFAEEFDLEGRAHYQGPSVAAAFPTGGRFHPNYTLFDLEARVALERAVHLQAGIENVTDSRAEVVLDYPLPGRLYYLGLQFLL